MNNYKRITMREFAGVTGDKTYNRLAELEDKIENGELASTVTLVKECLQVLRDTRIARARDDYSRGWNKSIDRVIEQLADRYCIDEEVEE